MDRRLEPRYCAIKISQLSPQQLHALETCLWENKIGSVDCVVIESDWTEFIPTVDMPMGRIARETPHD